MQDIPKILKGKIFEERFDPDIFDIHKEQRYANQKFYQKGSITISGKSQECYFLTGTWNEYPSPNQPPVKARAVTDGVDFSTVVIAKNKSEALEKILQMLNSDYVSGSKKKYILYPAFWQLQAKARGVQQAPWKRKATALAVFLYKWLRIEILEKKEAQRYPPINSELHNLALPKIQWQRADTVKKLTYALVKRAYPELSVATITFDKRYIQSPEGDNILSIYDDEFSWTSLANKFFHNGEPFLWFLYYKDDWEILVIQKPDSSQIFDHKPLNCSFKVYRGGKNWEVMELTCKRVAKSGFYYWWDTN
jgi:hypothetical protein